MRRAVHGAGGACAAGGAWGPAAAVCGGRTVEEPVLRRRCVGAERRSHL